MIQIKDILLCSIVTAIWGANFSVIRIGLNEMDPFVLTTLRFFLCSIPLVFFVKRPTSYKVVVLHGFIFGTGLWGMVHLGMHVGISPGLSSLFLQFSAFFSVFWGVFIFKEKVNSPQFIGFFISIFGLVFMLFNSTEKSEAIGGGLVLFAAFSWSICNIIIKQNNIKHMLPFIIHSSLYSAISLLLLTILIKGYDLTLFTNHINTKSIFSIVFQAYVTTLFGYWVWNVLISKYDLSIIAPFSLLVPIFGILTSIVVLNEHIDKNKFLGVSVLLFGLAIFIFNKNLINYFRKQ